MPKVTFEMESVSVDIPDGQTIWHAAQKARIQLQRGFSAARPCQGAGHCTGTACSVYLRTPDQLTVVSPPTWREKWFHRRALRNHQRLACQCVPRRDLTVVTMP